VKINKKLFFLLFIISVLIIGVFFTKSLVDEKLKVVVVLKEEKTEYWEMIKAGAENGFQDFGIEGEVIVSQDGSIEDLKNILNNVFKEKADVLIFSHNHSYNLLTELERFTEVEIPVLLLSTNLDWEKKSSFIGTNNYNLGEKAGGFLASELQPEDKVAIISGD
jgi:ribose transport system substrate-binding protein